MRSVFSVTSTAQVRGWCALLHMTSDGYIYPLIVEIRNDQASAELLITFQPTPSAVLLEKLYRLREDDRVPITLLDRRPHWTPPVPEKLLNREA